MTPMSSQKKTSTQLGKGPKWLIAAVFLVLALVSQNTGLLGLTGSGDGSATLSVEAVSNDGGATDDEDAVVADDDAGDDASSDDAAATDGDVTVTEDGTYTSKDEVALYIHTYGHLPSNFISKTKAKEAGWVSSEGNLDEVCPGMSIGGSRFYNDEGLLPDADGRTWTECDINYTGGFRGSERIVFSNDGLIYYTNDHYQTFERLY